MENVQNKQTGFVMAAGTGLMLVALMLVAGWTTRMNPAHEGDPAAVVEMTNMLSFAPDTVYVTAGETVAWKNTSLLVHTVTDDTTKATIEGSALLPDGARGFDSGYLQTDQTFEHTFAVAGTYRYFCIPHEGAKMIGTVIVKAAK